MVLKNIIHINVKKHHLNSVKEDATNNINRNNIIKQLII